jgi:6-phosphogluconolactonase
MDPILVGWEPTQGKTPRFFGLDPAANFLHAADQDSDTVVIFRVNPGDRPVDDNRESRQGRQARQDHPVGG